MGLVALSGWVFLGRWVPLDVDGPVVCLSRRLLDLPCPACGLTRAMLHLAHGDLGAAMGFNPVAALLVVETIALWLGWGLWQRRGLPFAAGRVVAAGALATAVVLVALWTGRVATGTLPW